MPKRKSSERTTAEKVRIEEPLSREELPERADPSDQSIEALEEFLADTPQDDVYIVLFREMPDKQWARLDRVRPDQLTIDDIPKRYGGGRYRVRAYQKGGKYLTQQEVLFDPRLKGELDRSAEPAQTPASPPAGLDMREMFTILRDDMKRQSDFMLQLAEKITSSKPANPLEHLKGLMELRQLFGDNSVKPKDLLEVFQTGMELARDSDTGGSVTDKILDKLATHVLRILPAAGQALTRGAATPGGAPTPKPSPEGVHTMTHQPNALTRQLSIIMPHLIESAKAGGDPAIDADFIVSHVSESAAVDLVKFLQDPQWVDKLAAQVPQVHLHAEWFRKLGGLIVEAFTEPEVVNVNGSEPAPSTAG